MAYIKVANSLKSKTDELKEREEEIKDYYNDEIEQKKDLKVTCGVERKRDLENFEDSRWKNRRKDHVKF